MDPRPLAALHAIRTCCHRWADYPAAGCALGVMAQVMGPGAQGQLLRSFPLHLERARAWQQPMSEVSQHGALMAFVAEARLHPSSPKPKTLATQNPIPLYVSMSMWRNQACCLPVPAIPLPGAPVERAVMQPRILMWCRQRQGDVRAGLQTGCPAQHLQLLTLRQRSSICSAADGGF